MRGFHALSSAVKGGIPGRAGLRRSTLAFGIGLDTLSIARRVSEAPRMSLLLTARRPEA